MDSNRLARRLRVGCKPSKTLHNPRERICSFLARQSKPCSAASVSIPSPSPPKRSLFLFIYLNLPSFYLSQELLPVLPPIITNDINETIRFPIKTLLGRLLLRDHSRPDWTLKVLSAHASACTLSEPGLSSDVSQEIAHLRERQTCLSLLQCSARESASPSAVQRLEEAAPRWLPCPTTLASEHLNYFSSQNALQVASAAGLLLESKNKKKGIWFQSNTEQDLPGRSHADPAVRAEILAMALCVAKTDTPKALISNIAQHRHLGAANAQQAERCPITTNSSDTPSGALSQELCAMLQGNPSLAVALPAPLIAQACRASFAVTIEHANALNTLHQQQIVELHVLVNSLRHCCLLNDHTALFFREKLETFYSAV